jgi:hypothetical protein
MRHPDTGKFSTARCVCAPHRAQNGTATSPIESCSMRTFGSSVIGPSIPRAYHVAHHRGRPGVELTDRDRRNLLSLAGGERVRVLRRRERAARLARLADSVPEVVDALGPRLGRLVDEYWHRYPSVADDSVVFCEFVRLVAGDDPALRSALDRATGRHYALTGSRPYDRSA